MMSGSSSVFCHLSRNIWSLCTGGLSVQELGLGIQCEKCRTLGKDHSYVRPSTDNGTPHIQGAGHSQTKRDRDGEHRGMRGGKERGKEGKGGKKW